MMEREQVETLLATVHLDADLPYLAKWAVGLVLMLELRPEPDELVGWVAAKLGLTEEAWGVAGHWLGRATGDEPPWPQNMARS